MSFKFFFFLNGKLVLSLYYDKKKLRKYDPLLGSLIKIRIWDYLEAKRLPAPDLQSLA